MDRVHSTNHFACDDVNFLDEIVEIFRTIHLYYDYGGHRFDRRYLVDADDDVDGGGGGDEA